MSATNADHAEKARAALAPYMPGCDTDTAIVDLLTDLMHLASEEKLDFPHMEDIAQMHFEEEASGYE